MANGHPDKLFEAHMELQRNRQQIEALKKENQELKRKVSANNSRGVSPAPQLQTVLDKLCNSVAELNKKMDDFIKIETKVNAMETRLMENTKKLDSVVDGLKALPNIQAALDSLLLTGGKPQVQPVQSPKFLILGGESSGLIGRTASNDIFLQDFVSQKITELPLKLPYRASMMGAVFVQKVLYVLGGLDAEGKSTCHLYSLSMKQNWIKRKDMQERRSHIGGSCVEVEGILYVIGGCRDGQPLRSVEKYDPVKDQWSWIGDMKECRSYAGASVSNGKIYVCGGVTGGNQMTATIEIFDPSSGVWSYLTSLPMALECPCVLIDGRNLLILGGFHLGKCLNSCWKLNLDNAQAGWKSLNQPLKHSRMGSAAIKFEKKIIVAGGYTNTNNPCWLAQFFENDVWTAITAWDTPKPIAPPASVSIPLVQNTNNKAFL